MISNLQLLRAFCALAVVYYHTGNTILGTHTELGGVALFFCISGFIMAYIPQRSARQFFADRLVRIAPVYWFATVAFFLWTNTGLSNPPYVWPLLWSHLTTDPAFILQWFAAHSGLNNEGAVGNLARSLLFVPYKDHAGDMHPLLGVGWTLNLEIFFYCIYALAIAARASIAPALACVTVTAVWAAGQFGWLPGTLAFYGHDYVLYFAYGIACYYAWTFLDARITWRRATKTFVRIGAATVFVCYLAAMTGTLRIASPWVNAACQMIANPPAVLLATLLLHSTGFRPEFKPALLLGNASYSLYLFHLFVMETMRPAGEKWAWLNTAQNSIGTFIAVVLSAALAIAAFYAAERPLTRVVRNAVKRRAKARDRASLIPPVDPATPAA